MEFCKSQQILGLHFPGFLLDEIEQSHALPTPWSSLWDNAGTQQPGLLPKPWSATRDRFLSSLFHSSALFKSAYGEGFSALWYILVLSCTVGVRSRSLGAGTRKTDRLLPSEGESEVSKISIFFSAASSEQCRRREKSWNMLGFQGSFFFLVCSWPKIS